MYFADDDLVAIHTLACAAREIYEKHCKKKGITRFFDYVQQSHNQPEKELWNAINGPRNFLKHPGDSLDDEITLTDSENSSMLFFACHDCAMLCGQDQPFEVSVFNAWYFGAVFPFEAGKRYREDAAELLDLMATNYPNLRAAPLDEQKRMGLVMLAEDEADQRDQPFS
jgi:sarcosine oxidase delta subunit